MLIFDILSIFANRSFFQTCFETEKNVCGKIDIVSLHNYVTTNVKNTFSVTNITLFNKCQSVRSQY